MVFYYWIIFAAGFLYFAANALAIAEDNADDQIIAPLDKTTQASIYHDQLGSRNADWHTKKIIKRDLAFCHEVRIKRLQQKCVELGLARNRSLLYYDGDQLSNMVEKVLVDGRHGVLLKAPGKTGTSSWKMILLNNTGVQTFRQGEIPPGGSINNYTMLEEFGLYTLPKYPRYDILYRLQSYFSIINVRHPLSRLESAYLNKLASGNEGYQRRIGSEILRQFGDKSLTPDEIKEGKNVRFSQFLRWLVKEKDNDPHWVTYLDDTNPCILPYSHVTKTETADDDMDFVVSSKLSRTGEGGHYHYNPSNPDRVTDDQGRLVLQLFSQLVDKPKLLHRVMRLYRVDMELFGYTVVKNTRGELVADCATRSPVMGLCC